MTFKPLQQLNILRIGRPLKVWREWLSRVDYLTPTLGLLAAGSILGLRGLGGLQVWELHLFDKLMSLRPPETTDERLVIVRVTEADIEAFNAATIPDSTLADLIQRLATYEPAVIALDLYRNVPNDAGYDHLQQVLAETPNLIGIEKVISDAALASVAGNSTLVEQGRSAASDLVVDLDGRVRRGFIFPTAIGERVVESLSFRVAYEYLAQQGKLPAPNSDLLTIDGTKFWPVERQSGGYVNVDSGGYQILMNWRNTPAPFPIVTASDLLAGVVDPALFKDRIVMIGSAQAGDADVFFTAYGHQLQNRLIPTHGVEIHANITSQIVSAVMEGRPLIRTLPEGLEIVCITLSAMGGLWIYGVGKTDLRRFIYIVAGTSGLLLVSYGALLIGWWLPLLPTTLAMVVTPLVLRLQKINQLQSLSSIDDLTQLTNRRIFKEQLEKEWARALRSQTPLSLIICDVDYFKLYNDTYGHPQGDECLRQVSRALKQAVRRPSDVIARYGGEEFVFLLPDTEADGALNLAQTARLRIEALQLPHTASQVSDYVTISMGVTSVIPSDNLEVSTLVDTADMGLYEAKRKGRNQTVLRLPWAFG
ncbi:MAG: diguanylate cyclase [Cyanobacteria bacterium P01_A01_bin.105]